MSGSDNHKPRVVLASRRNGGLRVTLLWAADTNTVAVRVRDDITNAVRVARRAGSQPNGRLRAPVRARRAARRRLSDRGPAAGGLKASEATHDMDATTLATEATRYLEAIDLLRSLGLDVKWRSEADEDRVLSPRQCCSDLADASAAPARSHGSTGNTSASGPEPTTEGVSRCQR
jgi:hypothetical protein